MQRRPSVVWLVAFWTTALAIAIFLLWLFNAVLLPFVVAIALGYLLDPLVNRLERFGMSRSGATSIILVGAVVVIMLGFVLFVPMLIKQLSQFASALPDLVKKAQGLIVTASDQISNGRLNAILEKLGLGDTSAAADLKNSASDIVNRVVAWGVGFANGLLSRSAALLDLASLIVITPVTAFYMLVDWRKLVSTIDNLVPPRNRETVRLLAGEIDRALVGFLRGQSLVCLFLAVWYGIGLTLIGVNFGLLIGIVGGLLSFIPYVGSMFVFGLSILIATVQGWPSWHLPVAALAVVLVGQFLEGNVLSPKLVGDKVGLHPVWMIFALLGFGSVFGFTGLIAAVPVASAIGVLLRFATKRYRESAIYTGELPPEQPSVALPRAKTGDPPPVIAPVEPVRPELAGR